MRSFLYWLAKMLGDFNAVKKNRIGKRLGRRMFGKLTGRAMRNLFK